MSSNKYPDNQWMISKLGKMSSSEICALFTEPQKKADKEAGNLSETAKTYIGECVAEIMTGTYRDVGKLPALEWGKQYEPEAAELLSGLHEGFQYFGGDNPKFFPLTTYSGGSPDAIIEFPAKICFEIKCPENPVNHIEFLKLKTGNDLKTAEKKYWYQLQMNMACLAKQIGCKVEEVKGIFVSYCPIMTDKFSKHKLFQLDVYPDPEFQEKLIPTILKAEHEIKNQILKFL